MLLRDALGETLRDARTRQNRTLRDVSTAANVSLGYLSEVERGRKEASSELLASICDALDVELAEILSAVSHTISTEAAQHVRPAIESAVAVRPLSPQLRIVVPYDNARGVAVR